MNYKPSRSLSEVGSGVSAWHSLLREREVSGTSEGSQNMLVVKLALNNLAFSIAKIIIVF